MNELRLEKLTQYYLPSDCGCCPGGLRGHYVSSGMRSWIPVSEMCGKILKPPSVCWDAEKVCEDEEDAGAAYIER